MAWLALLMFLTVIMMLLAGYPVALTLGGTALIFAAIGGALGGFEPMLLGTLGSRIFGVMTNETLIAVPLFVFMGVVLERARIAEDLLDTMAGLFGRVRGGLGFSVLIVGMLLAASTGIVGATVVTMGLLSLPTMLKRGYDPALSAGTICASGTLGQIIPPSIILVLLGDVVSTAYQQAQRMQGSFSVSTVSVGDLFLGAMTPGLLLVLAYALFLAGVAVFSPRRMPVTEVVENHQGSGTFRAIKVLFPPLFLMVAVLGSIITGIATPTEAAAVGAAGAMLLARLRGALSFEVLRDSARSTTQVTAMVFLILIGASLFSLVFRGLGGDVAVHEILGNLPGGVFGAVLAVMLVMFVLGFVLDFIEITFVVVPIVGPVLLAMGLDPVWLGVMIALNLQTSFLTPPFGFSLFYLRGVAPDEVSTAAIYRGAIPFVIIQLMMLGVVAAWPGLVTWLPEYFAN